jgi:hypothetical protein
MAMSRTILLFSLIIYLLAVGVLLTAVGHTYNSGLGMSTTGQSLQGNFLGDIVTGVEILPWFLDSILILIPFIMIIALIFWSAFPTGNAGQ